MSPDKPEPTDQGRMAQVQREFAAHLRNPELNPPPSDIDDRRMAIYRDLFYKNIEGFLSKSYPVIRRITDDQSWHSMVRDFYTRHRARTPMFPELPREFLHYLQDVRGHLPQDPPFLLELAHYEWSEIALQIDEADESDVAVDPGVTLLEGIPLVSPICVLLSYRFPVHRIRPGFQPEQAPEQPTHLLLRRNQMGKVRFIELNAPSAYLFEFLKANRDHTGLQCLQVLAKEMQHAQPEVVIDGGHEQMQTWLDRKVILGARKPA